MILPPPSLLPARGDVLDVPLRQADFYIRLREAYLDGQEGLLARHVYLVRVALQVVVDAAAHQLLAVGRLQHQTVVAKVGIQLAVRVHAEQHEVVRAVALRVGVPHQFGMDGARLALVDFVVEGSLCVRVLDAQTDGQVALGACPHAQHGGGLRGCGQARDADVHVDVRAVERHRVAIDRELARGHLEHLLAQVVVVVRGHRLAAAPVGVLNEDVVKARSHCRSHRSHP